MWKKPTTEMSYVFKRREWKAAVCNWTVMVSPAAEANFISLSKCDYRVSVSRRKAFALVSHPHKMSPIIPVTDEQQTAFMQRLKANRIFLANGTWTKKTTADIMREKNSKTNKQTKRQSLPLRQCFLGIAQLLTCALWDKQTQSTLADKLK